MDFSWTSLFESLRNLECVEIAFHSTMKSFIAAYSATGALKEAGPHHYDSDANSIPLPPLHSLLLEFKIDEFDDDSILDELIDILTMRDKHGHRLPVLSISEKSRQIWKPWQTRKSHLPDGWAAKLGPLVDKLEWFQNPRS